MSNALLVVNAGSSSIKFSVFVERSERLEPEIRGQMEGIHALARLVAKAPDGSVKIDRTFAHGAVSGHEGALDHIVDYLRSEMSVDQLIGIGHRVVQGGLAYRQPVRVDANVLKALEVLIPLAPLHQPHNLAPIRRALARVPELPQIACFDTAFHRTQPEVAQMFALPADMRAAGIMRYGFHGLSYEYIAAALPDVAPALADRKVVVLHLGNGASMCAIQSGRSVATTMGFSTVDGLPMGTRSGSLDPGVILLLMDHLGMDARAIEKLIYTQSGLLGVSGISSDMRTLLESSDPNAELAVALFIYRIRRELGSLAAALEGLDGIVFTGGIGENSPIIRSRVCRDAAWMGVEIDEGANTAGIGCISTGASRVAVWVIPTNEELMIARHTRHLIKQLQKKTGNH